MYNCAVISLNVHKLATVQTVSVFPVLKCLYSPADRETEIRYKHTVKQPANVATSTTPFYLWQLYKVLKNFMR